MTLRLSGTVVQKLGETNGGCLNRSRDWRASAISTTAILFFFLVPISHVQK
jgi:hypothetical protein